MKLESKKGIEVDKLDRMLMLQGDSLTRIESLEDRALNVDKKLSCEIELYVITICNSFIHMMC